MGPVVYKSGKFGLVSRSRSTSGNLTKQVVGLGNAPLLDGEKAAVVHAAHQARRQKILLGVLPDADADISLHLPRWT